MLSTIIIIPARYASTRFPGKPLALIGDKPMIQHVVERAKATGHRVVVATDDERIRQAVERFGGEAVMTDSTHLSGTDRIIEAYHKCGRGEEVVLNLQGDEPFIHPDTIHCLVRAFADENTDIATLAEEFAPDTQDEDLLNPNSVKLVRSHDGRAIYFSRSRIPYLRGVEQDYCRQHRYYKHIGLYAFRANILKDLLTLQPSALEEAESLEQLRWLEAGYNIRVLDSPRRTIGIDTPEDLALAERYLCDAH